MALKALKADTIVKEACWSIHSYPWAAVLDIIVDATFEFR